MKTKNLIYLALAGAGIYFIYNRMKKKNVNLPTASAVKKGLAPKTSAPTMQEKATR